MYLPPQLTPGGLIWWPSSTWTRTNTTRPRVTKPALTLLLQRTQTIVLTLNKLRPDFEQTSWRLIWMEESTPKIAIFSRSRDVHLYALLFCPFQSYDVCSKSGLSLFKVRTIVWILIKVQRVRTKNRLALVFDWRLQIPASTCKICRRI